MVQLRPAARIALTLALLLVFAPLHVAGDAPDGDALDPTTLDALLAEAADRGGADLAIDDLPDAARQSYEEAADFESDGKLDEAAEALDTALREANAYPYELLELLARVKFRQGRIGEARVAAELAGRLRPDDPDVNYLLGKLALEQSLRDAAIGHFLRAVHAAGDRPADPRAIASLYELGVALESSNRLVAAAQAFARFDLALAGAPAETRRAPELEPILASSPRGYMRRAISLFERADRPDDAIQAARKLSNARPDDAYCKRVLVETLLDADRPADAATLARTLVDADGAGPLALAIRAAHAAGRLDAWVRESEQRASKPDDADNLVRFARAIDNLGLAGKSLPLWQALSKANIDDIEIAWELAAAQKAAGDLPNAISTLVRYYESFAKANDAAPSEPSVRPLTAWLRPSPPVPALKQRFQQVATSRDVYSVAVHGLGALALGDNAAALSLLTSASEQQPDLALAQLGLGLVHLREGRWDDVLVAARALSHSAPESALAHWMTGEAHSALDQVADARSAYKQAMKLRPKDADYVLALARLERREGDLLAAQRHLQDAWTLDASRGDALEALVSSYLEGGKIDLARSALDEAEDADVPLDALRRSRTLLRYAPDLTSADYLSELRRQIQAHPDDAETAIALANSLFAVDHYDELGPLIDEIAVRDDETRERVAYLRARLHLRQLEPDQAVEALEPLAARYPNRRATLAALAAAYSAAFKLDEARGMYARLLPLAHEPAQREQVRRLWIGSLVDALDPDAAIELLDQWIAEDPNDGTLAGLKLEALTIAERGDDALALARARIEPIERRFNELIDEYRAAFSGGGGAPAKLSAIEKELRELSEPLYALREDFVAAATSLERFDELDVVLRRWLEREPGQLQLKAWLIEAALATRRPDDALAVLSELNPQTAVDLARAVSWRARALLLQDKSEEAVRELTGLLREPAIRSNPRLLAAMRRSLVQALVDGEDYQEAVRLTDEWLVEATSDDAMQYELLTLQRSIFLSAERHEDHVRVAEKLLALEPLDPALNNDLGYSLVERGMGLERATEMIRRAVAAEPLNAAYLDSLGWAHYQKGEFETARHWLARAVELRAGQDAVVYDHIGDIEYRLGERESARQRWEKSIALAEERKPDERRPSDAELLAALRRKLDALAKDATPEVAPTAAEREEQKRP